MIDLIDKRIMAIILIALFIAGGAIGGAYYYVAPAAVQYENESKSIKSKADGIQAEIDRIRYEFEKIQSQIEGFKALQVKGFFNAQDRVTAREAITRLTRRANVDADIKFSAAALVPNPDVDGANYKLLSGPMSISIRSMNDVNAYKFVLGLQKAFPGYLQLRSFDVARDSSGKLSEKINGIRSGTKTPIVTGNVNLIWWSMASPEQLAADPMLNPALVAPQTPPPAQ